MERIYFQASPRNSFEYAKNQLNSALDQACPLYGAVRFWENRVLHVSAPGTEGFVCFDLGLISGEIQISFPATLVRGQIINELRSMLMEIGAEQIELTRR